MVEWFEKESKNSYTPSKVRELPDWALEIFSPGMIAAGNIQDERELDKRIEFSVYCFRSLLYFFKKI